MTRCKKIEGGVVWKELLVAFLILTLLSFSIYLDYSLTGKVVQGGVWIPIEDSNYINNTAQFSNSVNSSLIYNL